MKSRKSSTEETRHRRKLAELQVREYIERYHPEMANSTIAISSDGLIAGVSVNPTNSARNRRKRS
jgi:hypothetical protein